MNESAYIDQIEAGVPSRDEYFVRVEDIREEAIVRVSVERPFDHDPRMGAISWEDRFEYDQLDRASQRKARREACELAANWAATLSWNPQYGAYPAKYDSNF
jgi:hypothetical protein